MADPLGALWDAIAAWGARVAALLGALAVVTARWLPRLGRLLRAHRDATDAGALTRAQAALTHAQAAQTSAQADATAAATWAALAAEMRAGQAEARAAERDCLERYELLAGEVERMRADEIVRARDAHRQARLVDEMARRLGVVARATPSRAHDTMFSTELAPLDPTASTPPAGHRLTPPSAPVGAGQGPESLTPGGFDDDTPR